MPVRQPLAARAALRNHEGLGEMPQREGASDLPSPTSNGVRERRGSEMAGIFDPITIKNVRFDNRILRSSVGGRMAAYTGVVTDIWRNFERTFANGGVGGIISTTFGINKLRQSPYEYPRCARIVLSRRCAKGLLTSRPAAASTSSRSAIPARPCRRACFRSAPTPCLPPPDSTCSTAT